MGEHKQTNKQTNKQTKKTENPAKLLLLFSFCFGFVSFFRFRFPCGFYLLPFSQMFGDGKRSLLEKGSCQKGPFSRERGNRALVIVL